MMPGIIMKVCLHGDKLRDIYSLGRSVYIHRGIRIMAPSYSQYVRDMTSRNPSLGALSSFLDHQPRTTSNSIVNYVEIENAGGPGSLQKSSTKALAAQVDSGLTKSILAIVENLHPDDVETLGSSLDIDPFFFCGHIASSYRDIENAPPPPLLALPPSRIISRKYFNIHYQKVLDLGDECTLRHVPYTLSLAGNIPRSIRRLPALSGRLIGLLRTCTSVMKKDLPNGLWVCECISGQTPQQSR
jgi:hypothetical protein